MTLTEARYDQLVDEAFLKIEEALDNCDADIDYESAGGILTLIFVNGTKIILNKQPPLLQIWVATKFNGHHFNYTDEGVWIDERTDAEFWSFMNEAISKQAGMAVELDISHD